MYVTIGTTVHWDESEKNLVSFLDGAQKDFAQSEFGGRFLSQDTSSPSKLPHLMITGYIATTLSGICMYVCM